MKALGSIATRYMKNTTAALGGPTWLKDVWQVELADGTEHVALVLGRDFRKRIALDDFAARDQLCSYDFQAVLRKHRAGFTNDGLLWADFRVKQGEANLRDLIFFHEYDRNAPMSKTSKWRVVDINNRAVLLNLLKKIDNATNVENWLKEKHSIRGDTDNRTSKVYERYEEWCQDTSEQPVGKKRFSRQLLLAGIKKKRRSSGYEYHH